MRQAERSSRRRIRGHCRWLSLLLVVPGLFGVRSSLAADRRPLPRFERVVIDADMPAGYQVEVADVNGDRKPDIVALGGGTCAWYENPTWKKRIVTNSKQTPGIISTATADIDGDGKAEIAIAYEFSMNQPTKGKLLLAAQGKGLDDPWTTRFMANVGSIHRLRWRHHDHEVEVGNGTVRIRATASQPERAPGTARRTSSELIVAPIFGPSARPPIFDQEPAHLLTVGLQAPPKPLGGIGGGGGLGGLGGGGGGGSVLVDGEVKSNEIGKAPVLHAIDVVDADGDGFAEILGASNDGVIRINLGAIIGTVRYNSEILVAGAPGDAPKKGASEVHVGRLRDGRRFLATVEPWHGTDVAVYLSESLKPLKFGSRNVIDTTLNEGHALWVADVDGDGDEEIFAGYRGPGNSLLGYDFDGKTWTRTVVDSDIAAQDLRGGDLDGDGTPDVVAIGGRTHNVVWYRPMKD
jgi:hypothetical protein